MASIDDLFAQLACAQQIKAKARLSERNVVELVSKLTELGFLSKDELLHSANGREFLTRDRLRREVKEAVIGSSCSSNSSGRVPLVELPALLGVDLLHCEWAAKELVDEDANERGEKESSFQLINGGSELVAAGPYFAAVVGEVEELLAGGSGAVSLADLCSRFSLGSDVLTRVLEGATRATATATTESAANGCAGKKGGGTRLAARLEGGFLVTATAAARARATLRGALRGLSGPVQLSTLAKSLGIDPRVLAGVGGSGSGAGTSGGGGLASVVEAMLRSGEVRGALRGGGASFAPEVHSRAVAAASAAFYAREGYVEVSSSGGAAGSSSLPEGAVLLSPSGTVAVSPALVAQVDAAVEDACLSVSTAASSSPWVDVSSLGVIPPALSKGDALSLLRKAPAAEKLLLESASAAAAAAATTTTATIAPEGEGSPSSLPPPLLLAGTCVVSGSMLLSLRSKAGELALAEAAKVISEGKGKAKPSKAVAAAAEAPSSSSSGTAAANASKVSSKNDKESDDDDDWSMGGKSKKKGGGGGAGGKKNKGGGASSRSAPAAVATKEPTSSSPSDAALSLSALAAAVERWYPGTADAGIGEDGDDDEEEEEENEGGGGGRGGGTSSSLARALAALFRPAAVAAFDAAVADAASSSGGADSRSKKAREALLAAAAEAADRLQLYARGLEALVVVGGKKGAASGGGSSDDGGSVNAADASAASASETISRHLILRGPGVEAADALLRVLAFDAAADGGGGGESGFAKLPTAAAEASRGVSSFAFSPAERTALVTSLPKSSSSSSSSRAEAEALVEALAAPATGALIDALEAATAAAGSRFRRLERKAEKQLAAAARRSLEEALKKETSPAAALPLAASVALARLRPGRAVPPVPGRALGFLVGALAAALGKEEKEEGEEEREEKEKEGKGGEANEATVALFKKFHALVVSSLKKKEGRGERVSSEELETLLPRLKRTALGEEEEEEGGEGEGGEN